MVVAVAVHTYLTCGHVGRQEESHMALKDGEGVRLPFHGDLVECGCATPPLDSLDEMHEVSNGQQFKSRRAD